MSEERLLPIGTPVVLKKPVTERDIGRIEPCSYTLGRIVEHPSPATVEHGIQFPAESRYGVQFEGLTLESGQPMTCYFHREDFVLARAGT